MNKPLVGILMGSDSDWPLVSKARDIFKDFGIPYEVHVMSAHRSPDIACEFASSARARGLKTIICAAGVAAHLAGVIAAHTTLPVIGIPMPGGALNGLDALLSTVQMPAGIPVATVAVGSAGPTNAALLAVQIIGTSDEKIAEALLAYKAKMRSKVIEADAKLQAEA